MTEPTQAQIDAAKAELRRIFQDAYTEQTLDVAAKAALTAAAQMEKRTWDNGEPLNLAAAQVGDTAIAVWMGRRGYATGHGDTTEEILDELHSQAIAATIERCAQVAENELFTGDAGRDIAAAIRALKDQP